MTSTRWCTIAVVIAATSGPAFALKPGTHADVTKTSCKAAGLPSDFCQRAATEDYDTDSREWDDLRAHAQIDDGETACEAADRTAGRMWQLGNDMRSALDALQSSRGTTDAGHVGAALGRALHTIQDDCAHHGMPNPQHAWFSMSDFCDGTELSPDIQDDAIACARVETDAVTAVVAAEVARRGIGSTLGARSCPPAPHNAHDNTQQAVCQKRFLPGPFDACGFLARAHDWDGIDRTWENAVVKPVLRDAFAAGLAGEAAPASICGGDESVLSRAVSDPVVDVSGGPASCGKATLFCLGKADDSDNPFADDPAVDEVGGCDAGGGRGVGLMFAVVGLALVRRRRIA